jgi:DNA invertase Pin-like site-specific DNA recombinase|tara:strand:- start:1018 stop:1662 length:645 start_codon:yes stop_codon:yes gene_type:complete
MKHVIALVRVSTDKQDVANQRFAIQQKYKDHDILWFEEEGISGATRFRNRPVLLDAIKTAKRLKAPFVVYSSSRIGRTYEVGQFLEDNQSMKIDMLDSPDLDQKLAGFKIAMDRMERLQISERTKAALARIKAENSKKLGNPTNLLLAGENGRKKQIQNADGFAKDMLCIIQGIKQAGIVSLRGIADALNKRGVKTWNDKAWYPTTVKNLLART